MVFARRIIALVLILTAACSALAALATARGDKLPSVAMAGAFFDNTAQAKVLRTAAVAYAVPGANKEVLPSLQSLERALAIAIENEPLNHAALTGMALVMREANDERYVSFVESSSRASPRTPSLIGLSLEQAARKGNQGQALALLDRMMRLRPADMRELMPQFVAQIAANPQAFDLEDGLAKKPLWAPTFLSLAADEPSILPRLAQFRIGNPDIDISNEAIDGKLIRLLAESGDYDTAWQLLRLNLPERAASKLVADTQFAPFDWELAGDAAQTASLTDTGDLLIDFLSGGGKAASQVVALGRNPVSLVGTVRREGPGEHDILVSATCVSGGSGATSTRLGVDTGQLALPLPSPCKFARLVFATEKRYSTIPTLVTFSNMRLR